jgi:hypothetical protein
VKLRSVADVLKLSIDARILPGARHLTWFRAALCDRRPARVDGERDTSDRPRTLALGGGDGAF